MALLLACAAIGPAAIAQTAPTPAFEVATIRPTSADAHNTKLMMSRDKFESANQSLKALILFAYFSFGSEQQISGGPAWVNSAKFDVQAKEDADTVAALQKLSPDARVGVFQAMVQAMLAERFKLKVHHENKELAVYAMSVAKSGMKLKDSVEPPSDAPKPPDTPRPGGGPQGLGDGWRGMRMDGRGSLEARGASTQMFTNILGRQPEIGGRIVQDKTGLTGKYDFTLKWTPDAGMGGAPAGDAAPADAAGPGLFTALQEQLGLKLEATKSMVDTIVIDSVEMPSEN